MNRVIIVGSPGSGKSTLARRLHAATGLKLIHLDQHFFGPNWEEPSRDSWAQTVTQLAAGDQWIMDGNYGGTMDIRVERADTLVLMDFSTGICLRRVIWRSIRNYGKTRVDMAEGCKEKISFGFYRYVRNFRRTRSQKLLDKFAGFKDSKEVFVLRSDAEVENFMKSRILKE